MINSGVQNESITQTSIISHSHSRNVQKTDLHLRSHNYLCFNVHCISYKRLKKCYLSLLLGLGSYAI